MLKIKDVIYDYDYSPGCETCDYGSCYINYIDIIFEDDTKLSIKTEQMYEYMLSEYNYMQILSNSESIDEIIFKILEIVKGKYDSEGYPLKERVRLEYMQIEVDKKEIDIVETLNKKEIIYKKELI